MAAIFSHLSLKILTSYLDTPFLDGRFQRNTKAMTKVRKPGGYWKSSKVAGEFYYSKTQMVCLPLFPDFLKILPNTPAI